jgi:hypothetical protein
MTIGPEPRMRMEERSSRRGIEVGGVYREREGASAAILTAGRGNPPVAAV